MKKFKEAKEEFLKNPTPETAFLLHGLAWRLYLNGTISESDFTCAVEKAELFVDSAPTSTRH
jgi:hypothetical protein